MISLVNLPSIANDLTISIQDYLSLRFRYSIAVVLFTQPLEYLLKFIQRFLGSYKIECKMENDIPKSKILDIDIHGQTRKGNSRLRC